jgi:hypothetical protein
MALMMLQVTVPPRTNLVLKTVMATALMMHALAQVRDELRWSMSVFFHLVQLCFSFLWLLSRGSRISSRWWPLLSLLLLEGLLFTLVSGQFTHADLGKILAEHLLHALQPPA